MVIGYSSLEVLRFSILLATDEIAHCIRVRNLIEFLANSRKVILNGLFILEERNKNAKLRAFRVGMDAQDNFTVRVDFFEFYSQPVAKTFKVQGELFSGVLNT